MHYGGMLKKFTGMTSCGCVTPATIRLFHYDNCLVQQELPVLSSVFFKAGVRSVDLFIMPVKNKNGFGENTPSKSKKLVDEDEKDADGKHDDCSDLTDNNNDTEESTSRSFPQKVRSFSCFRCMRRSEYVKRQGFNVSSRALSIRPSSDCDCDK